MIIDEVYEKEKLELIFSNVGTENVYPQNPSYNPDCATKVNGLLHTRKQ
jgi:hypothetical protein